MVRSQKCRIVIQARINSNRLPAKVLLPVADDVPLFVGVYNRARNGFADVIIATSDAQSDDILVSKAKKFEMPVVRGPLDDVLSRFLIATDDLKDQDVCVRLTCDNIFPDGGFVHAMLSEWRDSGADYLRSSDKLPYGLACEVMHVAAIRQASKIAIDAHEREHVTPWIRKNLTENISELTIDGRDFSRFRCTVDTLDDYLRIEKFFRDCPYVLRLSSIEMARHFINWSNREVKMSGQ